MRRANIFVYIAVAAIAVPINGVAQTAAGQNARGVVEAASRATLSAGVASSVTELPFRQGDSFSKGDVLLEFSCAKEKAEAGATRAAHAAARQTYLKNQELLEYDAAGRFDVEIAKADMEKAAAEVAESEAVLDACIIRAPFDGAVVATRIHPHETSQLGQVLLDIVNISALEVNLIAPSNWLQWLKTGDGFDFAVDDTGRVARAHVARIGAAVDPVSQTVQIIGVLDDPDTSVRPGMSGEARFHSTR